MRRVIVESPYRGDPGTPYGDLERNLAYLDAALADCLARGEAPFASIPLYARPGILDDTVPAERSLGIEAGLTWGRQAEATVVYVDLGISPGMQLGIERATQEGRPVEKRSIPGWRRVRSDSKQFQTVTIKFDDGSMADYTGLPQILVEGETRLVSEVIVSRPQDLPPGAYLWQDIAPTEAAN